MAFHENISVSIMTRKEGDNYRAISYPPTMKTEDVPFSEHIQDAVYRCMNFTSKRCSYCELSGKYYDDELLILYQVPGAKHINNHHCAGNIIYHKDSEEYLKYVDMYFEWQKNVIQKHSWCDEPIKFQRSSGAIMESTIFPNSPLRFVEYKVMVYVEFINDSVPYNKWVPLLNYTSSRSGEIKGILELNPHLKDKELVLSINVHPEWMNEEREEWKSLMERELTKCNINYKFEILDS